MIFKKFFNKKIIFSASLILGFLFLYFDFASAAATYNSLVQIPGMPDNPKVTEYLSTLYFFLTSVVGVVAMGAIIIGGARYLTSVGNPSAIEEAKHIIYSAIYGLLLALTSWVIVREINPDILVLKNPDVKYAGTGYNSTAKSVKCALPSGPIGPGTNVPCSCIDDPKKDVFAADPFPPYVVSTTPTACQVSVPITLPYTIKIIYSEKMDKASVENPDAVLFTPNITATRVMVSDTELDIQLTAKLTGGTGTGITRYNVTVAGGGAYNKNAAGTAMGSDYKFSFHTDNTISNCSVPPVLTGFCDRVCGNKDLAKDNKYHCLKLDVKKGWVGQGSNYTDEQLRALATTSTSATSPFVSYDGAEIVVEVERASMVFNTPAVYSVDIDGMGGTCETLLDGTGGTGFGWYHGVSSYNAADGVNDACSLTSNPKGETCAVKFCVLDSQNNEASAILYYTILAP